MNFEETDMLLAIRTILLALFIAAPFGEPPPPPGLPLADDFAADAILTCPATDGVPHPLDAWTVDSEHAAAHPDENA